jgi:hypothetical protein
VASRIDKHDLAMIGFGCMAVVTVHFWGSWQAREGHSILVRIFGWERDSLLIPVFEIAVQRQTLHNVLQLFLGSVGSGRRLCDKEEEQEKPSRRFSTLSAAYSSIYPKFFARHIISKVPYFRGWSRNMSLSCMTFNVCFLTSPSKDMIFLHRF